MRLCTSNIGGMGLIPDGELRSHMPWGVAKKIENFLNLKIKIIIEDQIIF